MNHTILNCRFCTKEKLWSRITDAKLLSYRKKKKNKQKTKNHYLLALKDTAAATLPSTLPYNKTHATLEIISYLCLWHSYNFSGFMMA